MRRVIALGFFDGVHIGHGALLRRTAELAPGLDAVPSALTFDGRPEGLITGHDTPLLVTPTERMELMRRLYGIREVIFARFDDDFMHTPWRNFVESKLLGEYGAVHVVAGHDFHFGYKGEGNPERLSAMCSALGIGCDIIGKIELDGITVSSTYIRKLVAQGEVDEAARFLGHSFAISGTVVRGRSIGSKIGFPTVNIGIPAGIQEPAFGVYATYVDTPLGRYPAVTNVGVKPTVVEGGPVTVESTLFGFSGDLYGKHLAVEFVKSLRGEMKFRSLEELKSQIEQDAAVAADALGITG